jgi:hypothetical protein
MKEKKIYRKSFKDLELVFWWGARFDFSFEICDYFDNRPVVNLCPGFFTFKIHLPFRNKWTDECDPPKWGVAIHNNTFWIHKGGKGNMNGGNKWWTAYMPWSWQWHRTSLLLKTEPPNKTFNLVGPWEHELRRNRKDFYKETWKKLRWQETHPYSYTLKSGKVQNVNATIHIVEREWRMHWFQWIKWIRQVQRVIEVEFDAEVGERTGSWKGGVLGCNYPILENETPVGCLRRMERDRKFT